MKNRHNSSARTAGFTLCSAMVAALLAGCAGGPGAVASTGAQRTAHGEATAGQGTFGDADLAKIEARVAKSPRNATGRAALAQGYLAAGRFESAAKTFEDAVSLGDGTARTGLGLALAYIGSGRNADALAVLERVGDKLPASDFGLAVALAGQPAQGVAMLSQAVKGGDTTPKARQNLAYAYALDGRWAEARVIASQDVSGDELDTRLREWAAIVRPDLSRERISGLLGAPLRADPGQPASLALNGAPPASAPTAGIVDSAPAPALAVTELPAVAAEAVPAAPVRSAQYQPEPAPAFLEASAAEPAAARSTIERAFDGSLARVQVAPAARSHAKAAQPVRAESARAQAASEGRHLVQLGSFSTMEGAKRAWTIFQRRDASLRGHSLRITEADVNGRRYYRVAAEGFARGAAQSLCSTVKGRGGECLAYEDGRKLPGVAASPAKPMLASR